MNLPKPITATLAGLDVLVYLLIAPIMILFDGWKEVREEFDESVKYWKTQYRK